MSTVPSASATSTADERAVTSVVPTVTAISTVVPGSQPEATSSSGSSISNVLRRTWLCRRRHKHRLRHTFVTILLDRGHGLATVQDAARHASADTTRPYDKKRDAYRTHPTHELVL